MNNMPEGRRLAKEIKNLAAANKISDGSLQRAREELGIITIKTKEFPPRSIWILRGMKTIRQKNQSRCKKTRFADRRISIERLLTLINTGKTL